MREEEKQDDLGFKVNDRRHFDPDGTPRSPIEEEKVTVSEPAHQKSQAAPSQPLSEPPAANQPPPPPHESPEDGIEEGDFSELLLSLATTAQSALGLSAEGAPARPQNLPQAKHLIDLISMLERKTKGNLNAEEARLLQAILYDLRMRYLETKNLAK